MSGGDAEIQFLDSGSEGNDKQGAIHPTARLLSMRRGGLIVFKKGKTYRGDVPIFIHNPVLQDIIRYSETDKRRELGGMMIGGYHTDLDIPYIEIDRYIDARHVDSRAASIKFTHETWEDIHRRKEEAAPESVIVGWHHTHPGYGIFLSRYDVFIQEHFFSFDYQVALVVDPCANRLGFFRWRNREIVSTGFFVIHPKPQPAGTVVS